MNSSCPLPQLRPLTQAHHVQWDWLPKQTPQKAWRESPLVSQSGKPGHLLALWLNLSEPPVPHVNNENNYAYTRR